MHSKLTTLVSTSALALLVLLIGCNDNALNALNSPPQRGDEGVDDDDDAVDDDDDDDPTGDNENEGDDDDAVGDDDDSVDPAFVLELSPEPDETGFPVVSPMFVQFDQDPGTVDWTVMGPDGPVTMAVVAEDDGARRVGIPSLN